MLLSHPGSLEPGEKMLEAGPKPRAVPAEGSAQNPWGATVAAPGHPGISGEPGTTVKDKGELLIELSKVI